MARRPEPDAGARRTLRCAVYTRKSSEQGLEQDFNSLKAQREAAEAYILSQRHEGWKLVRTRYDDGGFSGGTLERPALKQLLADIGQRRVDVVVVYKVDRLTRSLGDFAKLVEAFDAHGVSFVSVTQQFNTTTSMGRLTLNVLLSFAQFEREVTGERIRDKFAASRAKGLWMGGHPPLGYDLKDRKLVVNETEAKLVRHIFARFCTLGTVARLKADLNRKGYRTKARISNAGRTFGGIAFTRGALYHILQNRAYRGEVDHKGKAYPGEHAAIVPQDLWARAHARLAENRTAARTGSRAASPSLLKGVLFDDAGNRMSPSHAVKRGRRYRYYVSQAILQHRKHESGSLARAPAAAVERLVLGAVARLLDDPDAAAKHLAVAREGRTARQALARAGRRVAAAGTKPSPEICGAVVRAAVTRVTLGREGLKIALSRTAVRRHLLGAAAPTRPEVGGNGDDLICLMVPVSLWRCGRATLVPPPDERAFASEPPRSALVKAVARGHVWAGMLMRGEVRSLRALSGSAGLPERYVSRIVRLGFLAPDRIREILAGRQPPDLGLDSLRDPPLAWAAQGGDEGAQ